MNGLDCKINVLVRFDTPYLVFWSKESHGTKNNNSKIVYIFDTRLNGLIVFELINILSKFKFLFSTLSSENVLHHNL